MKAWASQSVSLLLVLAALTGCGTDPENPRTISGGKYENRALGLSLQFPSTWTIQPDYQTNGNKYDIFAFSPKVDGYSSVVAVRAFLHSGSSDWPTILAEVKAELQSSFSDLSGYQEALIDLDGNQYASLKFTATVSGLLLSFRQDIIHNNGMDILVTHSDLASRFETNADLQAIAASMHLK